MMSTADGSVANPSYGGAGGTSAPPPIFRRTFVLRNLLSDGIFSCVHTCFMISYAVGGVIDHPPPPHLSLNLKSVTAALSALSVFGAAGTSWVICRTATRG